MNKAGKKNLEAPLSAAERAKRYRVRLSRLGARRFVLALNGADLALVAIVAKSMDMTMTEAIRTLMRRGIASMPGLQERWNAVNQAYKAGDMSSELIEEVSGN